MQCRTRIHKAGRNLCRSGRRAGREQVRAGLQPLPVRTVGEGVKPSPTPMANSDLPVCRLFPLFGRFLADLVLRFRLEIAGVVALVKLVRRVAHGAVDHAAALDRRPGGDQA